MKDYLLFLISPLLLDKEGIGIAETVDDGGRLFTLSLSKINMGRIIGKQGQNIEAVRVLMRAFSNASQNQEKVSVKVNEPN